MTNGPLIVDGILANVLQEDSIAEHNIPPKKIKIYYVGGMKRHFLTNYQPPGTRLLPKYLTYRSSNWSNPL